MLPTHSVAIQVDVLNFGLLVVDSRNSRHPETHTLERIIHNLCPTYRCFVHAFWNQTGDWGKTRQRTARQPPIPNRCTAADRPGLGSTGRTGSAAKCQRTARGNRNGCHGSYRCPSFIPCTPRDSGRSRPACPTHQRWRPRSVGSTRARRLSRQVDQAR